MASIEARKNGKTWGFGPSPLCDLYEDGRKVVGDVVGAGYGDGRYYVHLVNPDGTRRTLLLKDTEKTRAIVAAVQEVA